MGGENNHTPNFTVKDSFLSVVQHMVLKCINTTSECMPGFNISGPEPGPKFESTKARLGIVQGTV